MLRLTGGQALLRALKPEQVPWVFGVVGGKLAPLLQALAQDGSSRYLGCRHEGAACMMASAVFAGSGQLGLVVAECGSGGGNLVPGIAMANSNNLPLFAVTSNNQHAASYPNRGMFADMDTASVLRPIVKWNCAVHDGRRLPELVRWGLREAFTGRPGPVHLDIPQDILRRSWDYDEHEFPQHWSRYRSARPAPGDLEIEAIADLLAGARRPLLIAGGGVTAAGATQEFRALASALNAPAIATQTGIGNVDTLDPGYIGAAWILGGEAVQRAGREADVVLAVGCRFSSWMWSDRGTMIGRNARVVQIDVDPAAIGKQLPIDVGMCADAKLALAALLAAVQLRLMAPPPRDWLTALVQIYSAHRDALLRLAQDRSPVMHPATLAQAFGELMPENALITFDGGHTAFWSNDFTPVHAPRTRFNEPGMSQLGFGLPWALTLKLLHPKRPVFNVTGDGAFGFTLQELDTARRHDLAVINVVHNNASWGIIKFGYETSGFDIGTSLAGTDYAAIARGFGGHGEVVRAIDEFAPALQRAIASKLPAVLDCRVRFEPHPSLRHFALMSGAGA
jgi:thiamine pyrophosphate-dependent acetolactate synthase large subunit-like protein